MHAVLSSNTDAIQVMSQFSGIVRIMDYFADGRDAFEMAISSNCFECVRSLVKVSKSELWRNPKGMMPIHIAARFGSQEMFEFVAYNLTDGKNQSMQNVLQIRTSNLENILHLVLMNDNHLTLSYVQAIVDLNPSLLHQVEAGNRKPIELVSGASSAPIRKFIEGVLDAELMKVWAVELNTGKPRNQKSSSAKLPRKKTPKVTVVAVPKESTQDHETGTLFAFDDDDDGDDFLSIRDSGKGQKKKNKKKNGKSNTVQAPMETTETEPSEPLPSLINEEIVPEADDTVESKDSNLEPGSIKLEPVVYEDANAGDWVEVKKKGANRVESSHSSTASQLKSPLIVKKRFQLIKKSEEKKSMKTREKRNKVRNDPKPIIETVEEAAVKACEVKVEPSTACNISMLPEYLEIADKVDSETAPIEMIPESSPATFEDAFVVKEYSKSAPASIASPESIASPDSLKEDDHNDEESDYPESEQMDPNQDLSEAVLDLVLSEHITVKDNPYRNPLFVLFQSSGSSDIKRFMILVHGIFVDRASQPELSRLSKILCQFIQESLEGDPVNQGAGRNQLLAQLQLYSLHPLQTGFIFSQPTLLNNIALWSYLIKFGLLNDIGLVAALEGSARVSHDLEMQKASIANWIRMQSHPF